MGRGWGGPLQAADGSAPAGGLEAELRDGELRTLRRPNDLRFGALAPKRLRGRLAGTGAALSRLGGRAPAAHAHRGSAARLGEGHPLLRDYGHAHTDHRGAGGAPGPRPDAAVRRLLAQGGLRPRLPGVRRGAAGARTLPEAGARAGLPRDAARQLLRLRPAEPAVRAVRAAAGAQPLGQPRQAVVAVGTGGPHHQVRLHQPGEQAVAGPVRPADGEAVRGLCRGRPAPGPDAVHLQRPQRADRRPVHAAGEHRASPGAAGGAAGRGPQWRGAERGDLPLRGLRPAARLGREPHRGDVVAGAAAAGAPHLLLSLPPLHDHLRLPGLRAADQRPALCRLERGLPALGRDTHPQAQPARDRQPERLLAAVLRRGGLLAAAARGPGRGRPVARGRLLPAEDRSGRAGRAHGRPRPPVGRQGDQPHPLGRNGGEAARRASRVARVRRRAGLRAGP